MVLLLLKLLLLTEVYSNDILYQARGKNMTKTSIPNIYFIGPSFTGKTAISSIVAKKLGVERLNFDGLIKYHNIHNGEEDEMLIA